ncbi:MAG TPA: cobaltochelatase subunit CobN [Synechococcales cyanobacterium M55_K2018_004]|nr:cobaltochelatase subunit CobN [Synechococcales cyanobacterium M55_K2018_004]
MHRLAATPGGWDPDTAGVIFLEQTPAPIVVLSAADTDIQAIAHALPQLPTDFPPLRVANLLNLQQQLTIDTYAESVLEHAQVIVLRLLGGRAYWPYGLEVVKQTVVQTGATLFVLPGDDRPDPDLISHSTAALSAVNQLWHYFNEGGIENIVQALQFIANFSLNKAYPIHSPTPIPKIGRYPWPHAQSAHSSSRWPTAALLFYRAHYLAGNTQPIDALCEALAERQLTPLPIFVSSLRDRDVQMELLAWLQPQQGDAAQILLNTTSFSLAQLDSETPALELWQTLDIPVLQVILSSGTETQWRSQLRGLSPRDVAMNVALPEVDGRIITRAVSCKTVQEQHPHLETDVVRYAAVSDRVQFTADLAANWVRLRQTPAGDRRIALILANYPNRDGRLANGVGLDTPASCVAILTALQQAGYRVGDLPESGAELIHRLTATTTNDPESHYRPLAQTLSEQEYQTYFHTLPAEVRAGILARWPHLPDQPIPIPGLQLGNVFVGLQPARGYDLDPSLNYHAPDLEPPHAYLACYHWVRSHFNAQAIVHLGKHGNLEWLPGKSVALSETCYPEVVLGPLPHLYPFIVNDPGEGSQAKRRAQAVIIDHLTPPLTRAELYGPLQQLEALIDEYYEAQSLDPSRLSQIGDRIQNLIIQANLSEELLPPSPTSSSPSTPPPLATLLTHADTYLCSLKEAQIRDGLHIFGQCPQGRQLRDLIIAIARHPAPGRLGLTRAIAQSWNLDFDPLTTDPGIPWEPIAPNAPFLPQATHWRTVGDAIEALEQEAAHLVDSLLTPPTSPISPPPLPTPLLPELTWIRDRLLPALLNTCEEITHLLHGLDGGYVPSGASGAPTRGRPEVLPTGRNFYSVDIRAIPTESAWDVGRKAAEALVERYTQEQGEYPQTLGLSIWGTSTMRTGGDDLAEALALLGVRPVWDGPSRRVVDVEILPLSVLGRPRVDVTLRISGFFRDAFPNLIDLFHRAVTAVAALAEPPEQNPLAAKVRQEAEEWQAKGLAAESAVERSLYRIFGSKPGAYGAGLQGLIEAQNWTTDADLARAYINWSGYAYTSQGEGRSAPEAFEQRLKTLQIVLHNQDNREHDLLDSDDYYQFQGGLTAAVRVLQGKNPQTYFGDHALPERPRIRTLKEEITRVYRSRVVNPKWIAGVMRHGYKGAFEMAATVDYLFAYSATAQCVPSYVYEGVAKAYLLDPHVQSFVQQSNPWALRDMAERLLEAHQRGLWQGADKAILEELRAIAHQAEGVIEMRI